MAPMISGVYAIVDAGGGVAVERAESAAQALLAGGVRLLQLRAKSIPIRDLLALARRLRAITRSAGAQLIINDRPDVAVIAEADGVHLGQADLPAEAVRPWLPAGMAIGVSCHDLAQVEAALRGGAASYLGYGPVYPTRSKESPDPVTGIDGLSAACRLAAALPVVAIGGITVAALPEIRAAGARSAAMISDLLARGDIEARARAAVAAFGGPT